MGCEGRLDFVAINYVNNVVLHQVNPYCVGLMRMDVHVRKDSTATGAGEGPADIESALTTKIMTLRREMTEKYLEGDLHSR